MMACGIDIIEVERIQKAVENTNGFLKKVFSDKEIEYFEASGRRYETLAGFYAAKEAFVKYKKTGIRGLELSEISVEHEKLGAPFVFFRGEKQDVSLSISHNKTQAVAVVCGIDKDARSVVDERMKMLIPKRSEDANKGSCGRVFVVAGSEGMTGAAILAARGALRSGAGLVTVGTVASERHIVAVGVVEAMTLALDGVDGKLALSSAEKICEFAKKCNCVVFGPGLGRNEFIHGILKKLLSDFEGVLIIDADGLNALSENPDILDGRSCDVVITPHPGEMSRLMNKSIEDIQKNRTACAVEFATRYGITVLLKGKDTVVADGKLRKETAESDALGNAVTDVEDGIYINKTGNCGMATGGSGDVLSGVIASFAAQGLKTFDATVLGAYIHGKAGDMAAKKFGIHGLCAGDLTEFVAFALADEVENR